MSRGLGRKQSLFLQALAAIEAENGPGLEYRLAGVVARVYQMAPDLQERTAAMDAASKARDE